MMRLKTRVLALWIAVGAIWTSNVLVAQVTDVRPQQREQTERQQPRETEEILLPPMEAPIDPVDYIVGPGDVFGVNIWINPPLNAVITVSPEGTLIVPTVGEVAVSDLNLQEAREKVLDAVRTRYRTGEPTVTLLRPRRIVVIVRGAVEKEGNQVLYSTNRVQSAIVAANPTEGLGRGRFSLRNIRLSRRDGTVQRVDIVRFLATHEDRWNPFLREGDEIFVARFDEEKEAIGIYGGVNVPGRYEFAQGDSLGNAIELAGGLTARALADSVILSRLDRSGEVKGDTMYSLNQIREGQVPDAALQPGDRIFVRERPEFRRDYRVHVTGEVMDPGIYPITRNSTKLSEVVRMAGGFTRDASLHSSFVYRKSVPVDQEGYEYVKSYRGMVAPYDSTNYLVEAALRIKSELVHVDFDRLFAKKDSSADVVLHSEDSVVIARATKTVYVFGQVLNPGYVSYVQDKDADFYVREAGGYADRANTSRVLVIRRGSGQALDPGEALVQDGDYVWVPMDPDRPPGYYLSQYTQGAVILSAIASVTLLIIQISK